MLFEMLSIISFMVQTTEKKSFLELELQSPPGKFLKSHFLPKTVPPQAKKKFVSPPSHIISEIFISPQKFGVKWHYAISLSLVWEVLSSSHFSWTASCVVASCSLVLAWVSYWFINIFNKTILCKIDVICAYI